MPVPLTINGAVFNYPQNFDTNWGIDATGWAQAVTAGMLQKAGGSFPLTANVNFGSSFGLIAPYLISATTNPAHTGVIRLAKTDTMAWRNNANSADLPLAIDGSDNLTYNGSTLSFTGAVNPGTANQLAYYATTSNAVSGLILITANMALESNASGLPVASGVSSTTLSYLDATSSIQTQINATVAVANAALPEAGGTMSGNLIMGSNRIVGLANGVNPQDAATISQVSTSTPTGTISMFGGAVAPSGWLLCDGSSYATATYPALFAVIVYTFGGAGANFSVPSFANYLPIGAGSIAALAATAGAATHTLLTTELPANIPVTITDSGHNHDRSSFPPSISVDNTGSTRVDVFGTGSFTTSSVTSTSYTGITAAANVGGSNTPFSIIPPVLGVTFIIKT